MTTTPSDDVLELPDEATPEKILWSCVARNEVILAEAGDDRYDGLVAETARGLLARKATPGFEFHQVSRKWPFSRKKNSPGDEHVPQLRGIKLHVFEHDTEDVVNVRIWVFAAVYDTTTVEQVQVQSFLEKIVALTEVFREEETWRTGGTLACQAEFAPILLQRMQEVTYLGRMAMLQDRLQNSRQIMHENIDLLFEREDQIQNKLSEKSTKMKEMASVFQKRSRKVRRMKMMQNAKHGALMGTAVTAGVAIVVVPPLIAIL